MAWRRVRAVAARTARVRLGILVNVLGRRRVGKVARESVTLDQLSHGRLVFGAGLGSLAEEFTAFGEPGEAKERAARALESETRITSTVDIRPVLERKRAALFAHGSQINDSWFSKLPQEIAEQAFGYEYFIRTAANTGTPLPEDDLFAGLRTGA